MKNVNELKQPGIEMDIDSIIKKVWTEKVKPDYDTKFLLYEDSLKNSLYYHIRSGLENYRALNGNLRIYTEYKLPCGRRADIAIVSVDLVKANTTHLKDCVLNIEALIEIKYKKANVYKDFYDDLKKMVDYSKLYPNAMLYAAFIQEGFFSDEDCSWIKDCEYEESITDKINELLGYWDLETNEFVVKVNSG